ncbi:MAG TPA: hypothetical protein VH539_09870 [Gemmatimonadaceae bacterium]
MVIFSCALLSMAGWALVLFWDGCAHNLAQRDEQPATYVRGPGP